MFFYISETFILFIKKKITMQNILKKEEGAILSFSFTEE